MFGKRYGEVLLVHIAESGPMATVYCSFPLNDCPQELWDKLDAQAIAAENGAVAARLNGPRHWLMSSIEKVSAGAPVSTRAFGGIEMLRQATVQMAIDESRTVLRQQGEPPDRVHVRRRPGDLRTHRPRRTALGHADLEPDLSTAALDLADLPGLAGRLDLPVGWRYQPRIPTSPLRVDTTTCEAHVIQDELANSYSLQTG